MNIKLFRLLTAELGGVDYRNLADPLGTVGKLRKGFPTFLWERKKQGKGILHLRCPQLSAATTCVIIFFLFLL